MRLSRISFRAWLAAKPVAEIVGVSDHDEDCPLARFVGAIVCHDAIHSVDGNHRYSLPKWASDFIAVVDKHTRTEITAARALKILDAIP